jgi:hypothetical protein
MKRAQDSFVPLAGRNLIKKKMKRSYLQKFIHSSRQRDLPHTLKMTLIDSNVVNCKLRPQNSLVFVYKKDLS